MSQTIRVEADWGAFLVFDVLKSEAERHLPRGVAAVEVAAGQARLLINVVHLLMGSIGIPAAWNLDVAIEVVPDETLGPIDRAAFEVRLTSESSAYLAVLKTEGHSLYLPRDLVVEVSDDPPGVEVSDRAGPMLSFFCSSRNHPGYQMISRVGQKLSVADGLVYGRNYRFLGRALRLFDPESTLRLHEEHPFFAAVGIRRAGTACRELMFLQPSTISRLDYLEKRRYEA